jgi:NAD(P)-dependent dehydrogenase (short-subunit alcohol dehydrogenase family)
MEHESFTDKVALVTGSSRGIGSAIARRFAGAGCDVVVNYRKAGGTSQQQGEVLCGEIRSMGRRAELVQADISVKEPVSRMFEEVENRFGRLDFLVLNAARARWAARKLLSGIKAAVETNFFGHLFLRSRALPLLEKTRESHETEPGSRFCNLVILGMKAAMECVVRSCESLRERR